MIKDHDYLIKLILIGSSGVGKTSILTQFAQNKFSQTYLTTIGVDFRFKTIKNDGKNIKFQIWDTAGQQRFRTITSAYYKGADGIIVVYDVTDPTSLEDVQNFWIPQAFNYCDKGINLILLGNKSDCPAVVSPAKVQALLDKYSNFTHQNVSAKNDQKIYESIKDFGLSIVRRKYQKRGGQSPSSISTSSISQNQSQTQNSKSNSNVNSAKQTQASNRQSQTPKQNISLKSNQKQYNLQYSKKCC